MLSSNETKVKEEHCTVILRGNPDEMDFKKRASRSHCRLSELYRFLIVSYVFISQKKVWRADSRDLQLHRPVGAS